MKPRLVPFAEFLREARDHDRSERADNGNGHLYHLFRLLIITVLRGAVRKPTDHGFIENGIHLDGYGRHKELQHGLEVGKGMDPLHSDEKFRKVQPERNIRRNGKEHGKEHIERKIGRLMYKYKNAGDIGDAESNAAQRDLAELLHPLEEPRHIKYHTEELQSEDEGDGASVPLFRKERVCKVSGKRHERHRKTQHEYLPEFAASPFGIPLQRPDDLRTERRRSQRRHKSEIGNDRAGIALQSDPRGLQHARDIGCDNKRRHDEQDLIDEIVDVIFLDTVHYFSVRGKIAVMERRKPSSSPAICSRKCEKAPIQASYEARTSLIFAATASSSS